jgi:hypothetical protein
VHPVKSPAHADQFDVPHDPLELFHISLITVMTVMPEKTLKTNRQDEVKSDF